MAYSYKQFTAIVTVFFSLLTGVLVVMPFALQRPEQSTALILAGAAMGAISGYRRRHSRFFFYLSIFAVLILSTILTFQTANS